MYSTCITSPSASANSNSYWIILKKRNYCVIVCVVVALDSFGSLNFVVCWTDSRVWRIRSIGVWWFFWKPFSWFLHNFFQIATCATRKIRSTFQKVLFRSIKWNALSIFDNFPWFKASSRCKSCAWSTASLIFHWSNFLFCDPIQGWWVTNFFRRSLAALSFILILFVAIH